MSTQKRKILYIFDGSDWDSRFPIAREAKNRGFDVIIGLIGSNRQEPGFQIIPLIKPFEIVSAFKLLEQIFKLLKDLKPDILHTVTLKYAFLCALVALPFPDMRKIYTLAGLGYLFHGHSLTSFLLRSALKPFLIGLFRRKNTTLIFQNPDDLSLMLAGHYLKPENGILIRGSGVDLHKFSVFIKPEMPPLVLMPTRLVREKGINIFIEAARLLKQKGSKARFQIAGGETTHNPKAISAKEMLEMTKDGCTEWLGRVNDMPTLLAKSTLVVYPSYYGEGIPRVLLEACAAGKAIVTTNHTGCREAVAHGINGFLVPIKDVQATADAIELLLKDDQKRNKMGELSRKRAESEFDITLIAQKTVDIYK